MELADLSDIGMVEKGIKIAISRYSRRPSMRPFDVSERGPLVLKEVT